MSSFGATERFENEENAADLRFGPDFSSKDAVPLMNGEVLIYLQKKSEDDEEAEGGGSLAANENAKRMFDAAMDYVQRFNKFDRGETMSQVRQGLAEQSDGQLENYEVAALGNLLPRSIDQAKSLIPSLQRFSDEELMTFLEILRVHEDADAMDAE